MHELGHPRHAISVDSAPRGFAQLRLQLIVSPTGEVVSATAHGSADELRYWPMLEREVEAWLFSPFLRDGQPVTVQVDDGVNLLPPERLPSRLVPEPPIRPESTISLTLSRSVCYGSCPDYSLTLSTAGTVSFSGQRFVVAPGAHRAPIDPQAVRALAREFGEAHFFSLDDTYRAGITDSPTYRLSLSIDGQTKQLLDYVGQRVGMPAAVTALERQVDRVGASNRWVEGTNGLVASLQAEHTNFTTAASQLLLLQAAAGGQLATVRQLLRAGVSVQTAPVPTGETPAWGTNFPADGGWLSAAATYPQVLQVLLDAGASRNDPADRDRALVVAASAGKLASVQALRAAGASSASGAALVAAARSGNPAVVREVLARHPPLEAKDQNGYTAVYAVAASRGWADTADVDRVACLRLLVGAGADPNGHGYAGNTALHDADDVMVMNELLALGADPNARNDKGETPLFTVMNAAAVPVLVSHGADPLARDHNGNTALEASRFVDADWRRAMEQAVAAAHP